MSRPQSAARFAWLDLLGSANSWTAGQTFSANHTYLNPAASNNANLWFQEGGTNKGVIYHEATLHQLRLRKYLDSDGVTVLGEMYFDDTGNINFAPASGQKLISTGQFLQFDNTGTQIRMANQNSVMVLSGGNDWTSANGYLSMYGPSHATQAGNIIIVPGASTGEVSIYNGSTAKVLETVTGGVQVTGTFYINGASAQVNSAVNQTPHVYLYENGNQKIDLYHDYSSHSGVLRKRVDSTPANTACQLILYDNGGVSLNDAINTVSFLVGAASGNYYQCAGEEQQSFSGRVTSGGTAERLPSGWTAARLGVGQYRVTHNLGTSAFVVVACQRGTAGDGAAVVYTYSSTTFDIYTYAAGGGAADRYFHFIMQMN